MIVLWLWSGVLTIGLIGLSIWVAFLYRRINKIVMLLASFGPELKQRIMENGTRVSFNEHWFDDYDTFEPQEK